MGEDVVIGATDDEIHVFDRHLSEKRVVSNGLLVGLHEIHVPESDDPNSPRRVWVAATTIDAALEIDLADGSCTNAFWPREHPQLQKELGIVPLVIDKGADNRVALADHDISKDESHLHLNAVATWRGELLGLFCKPGLVVNLETGRVLLRHPVLVRSHNLVVTGDQLFVNCTKQRSVAQFDLCSARLVRSLDLKDLGWVRENVDLSSLAPPGLSDRIKTRLGRAPAKPLSRPLFARGLQVRGDDVFVGVSPATVLKIDWRSGSVEDVYQHSTDVNAAVHGLQVAPV